MHLQLENKTAFISGSTEGIGFAIAKGLAQEGVKVILNGRTEGRITEAVTRLKREVTGSQVSGYAADFRNSEEVTSLLKDLPEIDILINNVGIYASKSFESTSDQEWQDMFEVNLMSAVRLSREVLPQMKKRNWGRILFVSSECAVLVPEDLIAYSTTKAAMLALSRGLAQTTTGTEVTVNTILPGSTLTEGAHRFLEDQAKKENKSIQEISDSFFKEVRTTSIVARFIDPKEVADTAVYLSSPLSSATNGAAIKLDGGSMPGIF